MSVIRFVFVTYKLTVNILLPIFSTSSEMNIAEDSNTNSPPRPNFNFSYPLPNTQPVQWNPGPPQFSPWGHSPNSPPARLVTFSAQPQPSQNMNFGQLLASSGQKIGQSSSGFDQTVFNHCKRKANLDIPV